jgi:hypothetical protein
MAKIIISLIYSWLIFLIKFQIKAGNKFKNAKTWVIKKSPQSIYITYIADSYIMLPIVYIVFPEIYKQFFFV